MLTALVFGALAMPHQLSGRPLSDLSTVRAVRALTADQARESRPVLLRGVVTVLSGWKSSFFLQDSTAGISVDRSSDSPELKQGQLVEVRGVAGPGLFAPIVIAELVTVIGEGRLPTARFFDFGKLSGGKQDSQWLAVRGIVRSAAIKPSWGRSALFLEIDIGGGNLINARVQHFNESGLDGLAGSTVSVRGVCGTVFNDKRQFVGLRLFVASLGDVKVERRAPADPFDIPAGSLANLLQFGDEQGAIYPIKVSGTVTYAQPGQGLYIQDGARGLFAQSSQTSPVAIGSRVEVVGYPGPGHYSPKLDDAVFRVLGTATPPPGLARPASAMIVESDGFPSAPYDSVLVQVTGRLLEQVPGADEDLLLFQDGASVFTARLPSPLQGRRLDALTPGTVVRITGICSAKADDAHEARSFEILLRSPSDLEVIQYAPWWTGSHAAWVVALLIATVLGMSAWLTVIRRQASLRLLTVTDPLTGVSNRRGFLLLAEQQWQLALRNKKSLLMFYIDLDHFKEINDSRGHQEGDRALQSVAAALRESFRKTDIIGRLGGDEFAVTAIDAADASREVLEERLARTMEHSNQKAGRSFQLSISVGSITCDSSMGPLPIEDLLAKADARMYRQKRERVDS